MQTINFQNGAATLTDEQLGLLRTSPEKVYVTLFPVGYNPTSIINKPLSEFQYIEDSNKFVGQWQGDYRAEISVTSTGVTAVFRAADWSDEWDDSIDPDSKIEFMVGSELPAEPKKPEKTFKKVYKPASMVNVGHFDATKIVDGGLFVERFNTDMGSVWEKFTPIFSKILIVTNKELSDIVADPKPIYVDVYGQGYDLSVYTPYAIIKSTLREDLSMPAYRGPMPNIMANDYSPIYPLLFIMTQETYDTLKSMG